MSKGKYSGENEAKHFVLTQKDQAEVETEDADPY